MHHYSDIYIHGFISAFILYVKNCSYLVITNATSKTLCVDVTGGRKTRSNYKFKLKFYWET